MVLPPGYPDTVDGMGILVYNTCEFNKAEMTQLRARMRATAEEVVACLDSVYDYDFHLNDPEHLPVPRFEKFLIVDENFPGRHDGKMKPIEFYPHPQAPYGRFHAEKKNGEWYMYWWAGELHTMYRGYMLETWDHSVLYDKNVPFEKAATLAKNACIKKWKVE
jgi:hypothetical protein